MTELHSLIPSFGSTSSLPESFDSSVTAAADFSVSVAVFQILLLLLQLLPK